MVSDKAQKTDGFSVSELTLKPGCLAGRNTAKIAQLQIATSRKFAHFGRATSQSTAEKPQTRKTKIKIELICA